MVNVMRFVLMIRAKKMLNQAILGDSRFVGGSVVSLERSKTKYI
jgi:hypothetical protein